VKAEVEGYRALGGQQLALQTARNIAPEGLRAVLAGQRAFVYSGHGNAAFGGRHTLAFVAPNGGLSVIQAAQLADLISAHAPVRGGGLRLVVLNACETRDLAWALIEVGVPDVVCWETEVDTEAATPFGIKLIEQWAATGGDAAAAFERAKEHVLEHVKVETTLDGAGLEAEAQRFEFRDPHVLVKGESRCAGAGVPVHMSRERELPPDVFISLRHGEAASEARALQTALRARSISTYINDSASGVNMGVEIANKLATCRLAIVMGSETYGVKTGAINSTFEQMQMIMGSKSDAFFLVKMCEEFQEPFTRMQFGPAVVYHQWMSGAPMPGDLVDKIVARLRDIIYGDSGSNCSRSGPPSLLLSLAVAGGGGAAAAVTAASSSSGSGGGGGGDDGGGTTAEIQAAIDDGSMFRWDEMLGGLPYAAPTSPLSSSSSWVSSGTASDSDGDVTLEVTMEGQEAGGVTIETAFAWLKRTTRQLGEGREIEDSGRGECQRATRPARPRLRSR
jgi:hypothetical protein